MFNQVNYSQEFRDLTSDSEKVLKLTGDSHAGVSDLKTWEEMRYFLVQAVNRGGSILDIGCANGFLLRCLQEWSSYQLTPFGIDNDKKLIEQAKKLFPNFEKNFAVLDIDKLEGLVNVELPEMFDFVYWNVWDNYNFKNHNEVKNLNEAQKVVKTGGRLILGFYHANKENNLERIKNLQELGCDPSRVIENPSGNSEVIAWFDM